jgi:hypothetical protein
MERRVAKRKADDPLRKYWNDVLSDKEKFAAWSRKMKRRKQFEQVGDIDMASVQEEVRCFGEEKKKRSEFYGYSSIVEEFPMETDENLLKIWEKRVANAKQKIDVDGQLFISKAPIVIIDQVESNMFRASQQRRQSSTDSTQVELAAADGLDQLSKFKRALLQDVPSFFADAPEETQNVDFISGNVTTAVERGLTATVLLGGVSRAMRAEAQRQTQQDIADMEDFAHDAASAASPSTARSSPALSMRKKLNSFETSTIERIAKLESSVIQLRQDKLTPDIFLDHLTVEGQREEAEKKLKDLELAVDAALLKYAQDVVDYRVAYTDTKSVFAACLDDVEKDLIIATAGDMYKKFFGKVGLQNDYREALRAWKKEAKELEIEYSKKVKAQTSRSSQRRKAVETDEVDILPSLMKKLKAEHDKAARTTMANAATNGLATKATDYPLKPFLMLGLETLQKLTSLAQFKTMFKWAESQLKKNEETEITCAIMNKLLLTAAATAFEGLGRPRLPQESQQRGKPDRNQNASATTTTTIYIYWV